MTRTNWNEVKREWLADHAGIILYPEYVDTNESYAYIDAGDLVVEILGPDGEYMQRRQPIAQIN